MAKNRGRFGILGFPETVSSGVPDIHMEGTREVSIEGCRGILEYENDIISLRAKDMCITVRGEGLTMRSFFGNHIRIIGRIKSVSYEEDKL